MKLKICRISDDGEISRVSQSDVDLNILPTNAGIIPDKAVLSDDYSSTKEQKVGIFHEEMPQTIITRVVQYSLDVVQLQSDETPTMIRNLRSTLSPDIQPGIQFWKELPLTAEGLEKMTQYEDCIDAFVFHPHNNDLSLLEAYKHKKSFVRRILIAVLLCLLMPLGGTAAEWNEQKYKEIEQSIQSPIISGKDYDITRYGAKPDASAAHNQKAIQKAIDTCSKKGGGRVLIPAGKTFETGAISLKSHVNLVVEEGAVLRFAFQPSLYPIVETSWEGVDCYNLSPCIYAFQQTDIAVTGKGTIDGNGSRQTWWPWCGSSRFGWREGIINQHAEARPRLLKNGEDGIPMKDEKGRRTPERSFTSADGLRPQLININQCQRILIEDITLLASPFWVIHPLKSTDITVRGVHINNDGPNGDGCNPESCDRVLIENSFFNTGDDCIAIKSGRNLDGRERAMPSQNIIIRHCEMRNGHGGVVIGSEISGGARNIFAHDCVMDSPALERVLRIKTNSCRGGIIENIFLRDITVGQCDESVLKINLDYEHHENCCRGYYPTVRDVLMENVTCQKSRYGVLIIGLEEGTYVNDITVRNCRFNGVENGNAINGKTSNILFDRLFVNGSLALTKMPYKHYSEWMTQSEMKRTPKSYMLDNAKKPKWSYTMGIELESMLDTYLRYGGQDILDYCKLYTDTMINARGDIRGYKLADYNLDNIRTGHFVSRMYQLYPEPKNLKAIQTLMQQLQDQPRTKADKVYWHKAIYAYQVWLDGIFMGLPFRCLTASYLRHQPSDIKPQTIYDDAVNQMKTTYEKTLDPRTGLNRHAYDETKEMFWADSQTGLSRHCWGRAQGWFTMALIEVLDALPKDYARRQEVITLLEKDLEAIVRWQDQQTGLWYQVMDSPGRDGNYLESTCSSMFAYALLKAYRKGYVGAQYRDAGIKAYRGIIRHFIRINEDQTLSLNNCCSVAGLGPKNNPRRDGTYQYYLSEPICDDDAKGLGPFIWASLEMEQLGFDTENVMQPINRQAVVNRNNPVITEADPLASLSVGNGHFATTIDITGLQSYPFEYRGGVPLTAMSDWGWHSFPNTNNLMPAESEKTLDLGHGHPEIYAVEYRKAEDGRHKQATEYFRANPHRLNLGVIGLSLKDANAQPVALQSLTDIRQELKLYDGTIESSFKADGQQVNVITAALQQQDAVIYRIKSPLLSDGRATVTIRFPYPTGQHSDDAADWTKPELHNSRIVSSTAHSALIEHQIDTTRYYLMLSWQEEAQLQMTDRHQFQLSTSAKEFAFSAEYLPEAPKATMPLAFDQALRSVKRSWNRWWNNGAIVDFSQCTDPRAKELERRVVLSQYLTQINCANSLPPQETGLTYNSWFGRPHLEMTWWHMIDFALWNRPQVLADVLQWYSDAAYPEAKKIAKRQGFKGIRWMKMTDPWAGEAPSNVGSFLIWQQPHYIYMAEELYRANPTKETLNKYAQLVEETAAFMADFVTQNAHKAHKLYHLLEVTAMQESVSKDIAYDQPFELAYWHYGLSMANRWRERQGLPRNPQWDDIIQHLSPLPQKYGLFTAGQPIAPTLDEEKSRSDHPAVLGPFGLLPSCPLCCDTVAASRTLSWVMQNWNWPSTWGWDYGMTAMAAARLGHPETALQALLLDTQKNTYLKNGHNFQTSDRLRIYLPGNGALLTAIAMMCAGWDGCSEPLNPGFPHDGTWNVRWENLQRMQ